MYYAFNYVKCLFIDFFSWGIRKFKEWFCRGEN